MLPTMPKQTQDEAAGIRHLGVRLDPTLHAQFSKMAERNDRTKQAEAMRLIKQRVREFEKETVSAA